MKIGLFFGAGAECSYGLPSGGQFALDIFRQPPKVQREKFRNILENIDSLSPYAVNWLPKEYYKKRIQVFGKREFTCLIESSIEYRKANIIRLLEDFDALASKALEQLGLESDLIQDKFRELTEHDIGEQIYSHQIQVNAMLAQYNFNIFSSEYYSAILDLLRKDEEATDLRRAASSILQLLVAAHGQELIQNLNQEIFSEAPDDIPIFDDVMGLFKMEYSRGGLTALEILLEEKRSIKIDENSGAIDVFTAISQKILENIFAEILDYQSLIDEHFRYLFSPKTDWPKFTKMVIFLNTVREYIKEQGTISDEDLKNSTGYYHDLCHFTGAKLDISAIGTANYNNLVERVLAQQDMTVKHIYHLNGGVNDFYDPFKNRTEVFASDEKIPNDYIYVPFLFTQSGLKPLTSISMSQRYVHLFEQYKESDAIVSVGYGFNIDDGHINGIFRELIEIYDKKLIVILRNQDGSDADLKRKIVSKLRITKNRKNLIIIRIDPETRQVNEQDWVNAVKEKLENTEE